MIKTDFLTVGDADTAIFQPIPGLKERTSDSLGFSDNEALQMVQHYRFTGKMVTKNDINNVRK